MKRTFAKVTAVWLLGFASSAIGCGDSSSSSNDTTPLVVFIESQDDIVSEDGALELQSGRLGIHSISLVGDEGAVPLLGPTTLDLALQTRELQIPQPIQPGSYTGLLVELAPSIESGLVLDAEIQAVSTGETIRAISELSMSGTTSFPEGPRTITEASSVELHLSLLGMFFYLSPVTGAVDGVYEAGESQRGFLTMDLVGMFDLRVLP